MQVKFFLKIAFNTLYLYHARHLPFSKCLYESRQGLCLIYVGPIIIGLLLAANLQQKILFFNRVSIGYHILMFVKLKYKCEVLYFVPVAYSALPVLFVIE